MISEHQFAATYTSSWNAITPLGDGYWHVENMLVSRFAPPMPARTPKSLRAVVNETAFRAYCVVQRGVRARDRKGILAAVEASAGEALAYVGRFGGQREPVGDVVDEAFLREATTLVLRLLHFFSGDASTVLQPQFPGCGLLSRCEGDLIYGDCLYEVKAGDRGFRVTDLRQLLIYSALAHAAHARSAFSRIGLLNPRTGVVWQRSLDEVCLAIAGLKATDTLGALVEQFSVASASR